MLCYLIAFLFAVALTFTGKAIADIVSDTSHWYHSIFSRYKIDGFWGSKDRTWTRKYKCNCIKYRSNSSIKIVKVVVNTTIQIFNSIMQYLFTTLLVWTTDIWHTANLINRIGIYASLFFAILMGVEYCHILTITDIFLIVGAFAFLNTLGFHVMYTYVLRRNYSTNKH